MPTIVRCGLSSILFLQRHQTENTKTGVRLTNHHTQVYKVEEQTKEEGEREREIERL